MKLNEVVHLVHERSSMVPVSSKAEETLNDTRLNTGENRNIIS